MNHLLKNGIRRHRLRLKNFHRHRHRNMNHLHPSCPKNTNHYHYHYYCFCFRYCNFRCLMVQSLCCPNLMKANCMNAMKCLYWSFCCMLNSICKPGYNLMQILAVNNQNLRCYARHFGLQLLAAMCLPKKNCLVLCNSCFVHWFPAANNFEFDFCPKCCLRFCRCCFLHYYLHCFQLRSDGYMCLHWLIFFFLSAHLNWVCPISLPHCLLPTHPAFLNLMWRFLPCYPNWLRLNYRLLRFYFFPNRFAQHWLNCFCCPG